MPLDTLENTIMILDEIGVRKIHAVFLSRYIHLLVDRYSLGIHLYTIVFLLPECFVSSLSPMQCRNQKCRFSDICFEYVNYSFQISMINQTLTYFRFVKQT